jgi:phage tail sheath protein FI
MPEYLAPGVYVEEVSFRSKSIEGVSTSTAGFVGPTRFGPITGEPELITSFNQFERVYGGLDPLAFAADDSFATTTDMVNFMAHAVRAFFDNGGRRLYVARVFRSYLDVNNALDEDDDPIAIPGTMDDEGVASVALGTAGTLAARFPGAHGNLTVTFTMRLSQNVLRGATATASVAQVRDGDLVIIDRGTDDFYIATRTTDSWSFTGGNGAPIALNTLDSAANRVYVVTLNVEVRTPGAFPQEPTWENLTLGGDRADSLLAVFGTEIANRSRELETPLVVTSAAVDAAGLVALANAIRGATTFETLMTDGLRGVTFTFTLTGGNDGVRPGAAEIAGQGGDDTVVKTGLIAFQDLEEISIVAAPGSSAGGGEAAQASANELIIHCENMRYRVAVLDSPENQSLSGVRNYRALFDSTRAAFYYPWVRVIDPISRDPIVLPPSGYMAGIYARSDVEIGVHKAPANEVVRGAVGLETLINKAQQDILNPLGINCIRYFENRGVRAWGARTLSSDPEWKYLNIRRYFIFLEHSIERSTQWAVFMPNGEALWANVRRAVQDFLFNEWNSGHLAGNKPEEAYFVQCDRSTMTQNDLDNGRMICLIGVAPLYPAEFVIFRIGQWTGDRRT